MYDELVIRLRHSANFAEHGLTPPPSELREAADAIEELSNYVQQLEKLRKEGWYLQKTEMMTYGQAIMTRPLPKPPEEEP